MDVTHLKANGIVFAIEDHGPKDAPALLLIRGQGSQMAHWPKALINGFVVAGYRTVIFDNRDVGLSQRCPAPGATANEILSRLKSGEPITPAYGIDDMADDVIGLMDALGVDKAHIFGISMGGMIAQQMLIQAADRLLSATLVMSSCRPASERVSGGQKALIEHVEKLMSWPMSREDYVISQFKEHAKWGSPGYPMPPNEIRAMAELAYDRGVDAEGKNRQMLATLTAPDRRPLLSKSNVPCFVIHGEDDTLTPLALGQEIATTIPGSDFLAVPGMGHIITPALAPLIVDQVTSFIPRVTACHSNHPRVSS